ncbi:MAG: CPBP family intramembrane metalloprotease [Dehalococcoidia bacterium]|nr:CPBP family intramembrane metalloprotease [Dehalococcoidia bacterium]
MSLRVKKTLLFILLTFVIDWSLVFLYIALGGAVDSLGIVMLAAVYMFVPMMATIIVQKSIFKQPLAGPMGISFKFNPWFFVAWFLPPILAFAVMGVSLFIPGVTFSPDMSGFLDQLASALSPDQMQQAKEQLASMPVHPIWLILVLALISGTTINAVLGFGEELGWRGFLQKELSVMGFWKSSALIGFIWGVWHAPLILLGLNYPQNPQIGVLLMIGWTILLAPLFSYIRLKSRSVIAASIFHGTINAVPGLAVILLSGGDELTIGLTGLAGFIVVALADLLLFVYDRFITREKVAAILRQISMEP